MMRSEDMMLHECTTISSITWIYCPDHAGVRGNEETDKLAARAPTDGILRLDRDDILKKMNHYVAVVLSYLMEIWVSVVASEELTDGVHSPVYHHNAMLGAYKREKLLDLPREVRLRRLTNLAKSHDANRNYVLEAQELKDWVLESYRIMDRDEAKIQLERNDLNGDGQVSFWEYFNKQYAYTEDDLREKMQSNDEDDKRIIQLITKEKNKFAAADVNNDGLLTRVEYFAFFQPHYFTYMHRPVLEKALEDLDLDKDGHVSLQEFIKDYVGGRQHKFQVSKFEALDKNKDEKLTKEELQPHALPYDDHVAANEVDSLISRCDKDKDGRLSFTEILSNEAQFIDNALTIYGHNLHFVKDEL